MGRMTRPAAGDLIRPVTVDKFGGYYHRPSAPDGSIWDEMNMWGGAYPCAESRPLRTAVTTGVSGAVAMYVWGGRLYLLRMSIKGEVYLYECDLSGTASPVLIGKAWDTDDPLADRYFAAIGDKLCIFPDMMIYDREEGQLRQVSETWTQPKAADIVFEYFAPMRSKYAGNVRCTIRFKLPSSEAFPFRAGDTVTVSGCVGDHKQNNGTFTVREVVRTQEHAFLIFYENTFAASGTPSGGNILVERSVPAVITNAVECDGRLWGYSGNFIYASALNDPYNWSRFDGISTDAFSVEAPGEGEITGVVSYQGAVHFFKETGIIRVYGSVPSEYVCSMTQCVGLRSGNERSVAVCGGYLYYNSLAGVMRWSGGSAPVSVSYAFGERHYRYGWGGSDGVRYYIRLTDAENGETGNVWMYDPALGEWFRYDSAPYRSFCYDSALWALDTYGFVYVLGGSTEGVAKERLSTETGLSTSVVFGDIEGTYSSAKYYGRKALSRMDLRMTLDAGVSASIWIKYDALGSEGDYRVPYEDAAERHWTKIAEATASGSEKRTVRIPIIPRRCDHFALRITTKAADGSSGHWMLHSMTLFKYQGTDLH